MRKPLLLISLGVIFLSLNTTQLQADDRSAFFEKQIRPLFAKHCVSCHGAEKQKGGLRLDTAHGFQAGGDSGPELLTKKPKENLLLQALRYEDLEMPPKGQLAAEEIALVEKWIADGAQWPADANPDTAPSTPEHTPGVITEKHRNWWAFQTPKRPTVPMTDVDWAKTPIDHFIAEKLTAIGLSPASEADRMTLIRRVTFDLTGLPPTEQQLANWEADTSENAYERLVDQLLSSPTYAERQARIWLDLVRYAESDGYRADFPRPHMWRYRNYVIRSFAEDKPYVRFLQEQLAGDELYPNNADAKLATGYLRLWPYEYNQRDVRGQWSAIINDLTDVTADVFLGLGFGCARCHDHKFDPILQKDYYQFQAFFAGLHFPDTDVFHSAEEQANYQKALQIWETKSASIRQQMDAMLEKIRTKERLHARNKFPEDILQIFDKPRGERTTLEQQLYELAYLQVDYEDVRANSKLKGAEKAKYEELSQQLKALDKLKPTDPVAYIAKDVGPIAAITSIPGSRNSANPLSAAYPTVLGLPIPTITPSANSSRRRATLAQWLSQPDHPLTARVMVNRLWQQHFGVGLVATASDYGTLGEQPSHPQLLDWLATEFVQQGWSIKKMHKVMVMSAVYQQSSTVQTPEKAKLLDPMNKYLWRMTPRRLEAEQVRDAFFAVTGELKSTLYRQAQSSTVPCRSIYTKVIRNKLDPFLSSFDVADGINSCACRNVTVTPSQSLELLNGSFALARATAFAKRVMPASGAEVVQGIELAFRLAYSRKPTTEEVAEARDFLRQQVGISANPKLKPNSEQRLQAWTDFCHVLLNSNEFLYVD